jgi:hypothetical protein
MKHWVSAGEEYLVEPRVEPMKAIGNGGSRSSFETRQTSITASGIKQVQHGEMVMAASAVEIKRERASERDKKKEKERKKRGGGEI